jgi:hypothetical protein
MKRLIHISAAAAMGLSTLAVGVSAAGAEKHITLCSAYGDGTGESGGTPKIDVAGNVTITAPEGYLIDFYCVKAGQDTVIVPVDPPSESVVLAPPNGKGSSHYSAHYIPDGGTGS